MKHWWVPGLQIGYEHTFIHQFADFLNAAGSNTSASPTFRDGLATDHVTDAILKSAKTGRWEKVSTSAEARSVKAAGQQATV
jgi:myo-inositol 2-dehydrogenase/D-chiro-inositol 1-dehydrogenase